VLVVKDELGAINQALLCLQAAKDQNLKVLMLVLNQIKSNSLENAQAISQYTDTSVVTFNRNNVAEFFNKVRLLIQQG
jgi:dethiobiotin synthetase